MLTSEEESFIKWWEANREREKKVRNRWYIGLPTGLVLALPVLLNMFSGWNKQVEMISGGQMIALLFAVLCIAAFMAIFSVRHKWEMREQAYKELMHKKNAIEKNTAGNNNETVKQQ